VPIKLKGRRAYQCNTLNINNKNASLDTRWIRTIFRGGYYFMREGDNGGKSFIIFYSPILELVGKSGSISYLRRPCGTLLYVIV